MTLRSALIQAPTIEHFSQTDPGTSSTSIKQLIRSSIPALRSGTSIQHFDPNLAASMGPVARPEASSLEEVVVGYSPNDEPCA
jgi:hypothetical protein